MDEKTRRFWNLFRQESFVQHFGTRGELEMLLEALNEEEVDQLLDLNVLFIRSSSPSSKIDLKNLDFCDTLILINFDQDYYSLLLPDEVVAIWLHEIGHAFNANLSGLEAEYAADNFAKKKGYATWIARSLKKGIDNNWRGFDKEECDQRIRNLSHD